MNRTLARPSVHSLAITTLTGLITLAMLVGTPRAAHAGSIEYLTNQSADYIRTFSRNAATDGADAAIFNPAGTAWLKDGIHLSLSSQTLVGDYTITYQDKKYVADVVVPSLPSFFAVYKKADLAVFATVSIPAGGGSLTYKDGIPYLYPLAAFVVDSKTSTTPTNGEFSGSSIFYAGTLGAAYKFKDMISVSLAGRVVMARKQYDGFADYGDTRAELHSSKEANGFGAIAGLTIKPGFGLTLAGRYELKVPMDMKATTTTKNMKDPAKEWAGKALESFIDGATEKRAMPAVLGLGLSWNGLTNLTLSTSYHKYFTNAADETPDYTGIEGTGGLGAYAKSWHDEYEDGWDLAFSAEYQVMPALLISAGYIRAKIGGNKNTYTDFEFALDSNSVGAGARYAVNDALKVTLGVSRTMYDQGGNDHLSVLLFDDPEKYDKSVMDFALGAEYVF